MEPNFSRLFHQSSKEIGKGKIPIPLDSSLWPEEWKTTYYKSYSRLPRLQLVDTLPKDTGLFSVIQNRRSGRRYKEEPITSYELSAILKYSCGIVHSPDGYTHRAQPSGGGRYPIEIYPLILRGSGGISDGLYHYNVKEHSLEILYKPEKQSIKKLFSYPWVADAACVFLFTSIFWRNQNKYRERGYRMILLEAGHIAQNISLVATALGLQTCALAGTKDSLIEQTLDIDGITESFIYAVAVGK